MNVSLYTQDALPFVLVKYIAAYCAAPIPLLLILKAPKREEKVSASILIELGEDVILPVKYRPPSLLTLNLLTVPTCRSISNELAPDAVSVTFILIAVNVVPALFQESTKS